MERTIKIGGESIKMKATAATAIFYRRCFHQDLMQAITGATEDGDNIALNAEIITNLAYIMAKEAKGKALDASEEDEIKWLSNFDSFDLVKSETAAEIIALYTGQQATTSESKN